MNRVMKAIDDFMIKHRRKLVVIDQRGNVLFHRYCILYGETPNQEGDRTYPNLYVHQFFEYSSDYKESDHIHRASTMSIMLKGGYTEHYNGKELKRRPGSINIVKYPRPHRIEQVIPNTWTIFMLWFKKSVKWQKRNAGEQIDDRKGPTMHYAGPDTDAYIARKKRAYKRLISRGPTS